MTTRPNTDLSTTGWIPSAALPLYDMLDEVSPSDLDYITSPVLGTGGPIILGLNESLVAGLYYTNIRVKTSSATGYLRIKLLNATNVVQGTSDWQTVTSTYGLYSIPVTIVGTSTRIQIEVSNNNTVILPTILSKTINSTGTAITLVFSEAVYVNTSTGFTITMANAPTMTYSSGANTTTLVYNLSRVVNVAEVGTLSYTQPVNGIEAISTRFDLANFSGSSITNSSTVGSGPGDPAITTSLTVSKVYGNAPLAPYFDAVGTTSTRISSRYDATTGVTATIEEEAFRRCVYTWDYNDTFGITPEGIQAPTTWSTGNQAFNNRNQDIGGPLACHIYEVPGTYVAKLTVSDGTGTKEVLTTIRVDNPNNDNSGLSPPGTNYTGTNTICVTNGSTGANNWGPVGCLYVAEGSIPSLNNKRLLFKRSVTPITYNIGLSVPAGNDNVFIDSYGTGSNPTLTGAVELASNVRGSTADWCKNITMCNLNINSSSSVVPFSIITYGLMFRCNISSNSDLGNTMYTAGAQNTVSSWDYWGFPPSGYIEGRYRVWAENTITNNYPDTTAGYGFIGQFYMSVSLGNHWVRGPQHNFRTGSIYRSLIAHETNDGLSPDGVRHCYKLHSDGCADMSMLYCYSDGTPQNHTLAWTPAGTTANGRASKYLVLACNKIGDATSPKNWYVALDPQNDQRSEGISDYLSENNYFIDGTSGAPQDIVRGGRRITNIGNTKNIGSFLTNTNQNISSGINAADMGAWRGPYYSDRG